VRSGTLLTTPAVSYKRHRFPAEIIAHAVWLHYRCPLSLRHVEEMLLDAASSFPMRRSAGGMIHPAGRIFVFDLKARNVRTRRVAEPSRFDRSLAGSFVDHVSDDLGLSHRASKPGTPPLLAIRIR
jgi:hypothetical protein